MRRGPLTRDACSAILSWIDGSALADAVLAAFGSEAPPKHPVEVAEVGEPTSAGMRARGCLDGRSIPAAASVLGVLTRSTITCGPRRP